MLKKTTHMDFQMPPIFLNRVQKEETAEMSNSSNDLGSGLKTCSYVEWYNTAMHSPELWTAYKQSHPPSVLSIHTSWMQAFTSGSQTPLEHRKPLFSVPQFHCCSLYVLSLSGKVSLLRRDCSQNFNFSCNHITQMVRDKTHKSLYKQIPWCQRKNSWRGTLISSLLLLQ